jgi:acyl-CoA thioesterase-1
VRVALDQLLLRAGGQMAPVAVPSWVAGLRAGRPTRIMTYGTSLTAGGAWVDQLAAALHDEFGDAAEVVNVGAGAMWSQWGVENLSERVLSQSPDVVFIEFAMNDAFLPYDTSTEACRVNLCYMLDRVKAALPRCECVLQCMNVCVDEHSELRPNLAAYYQVYRAVAAERRLTLIDNEPLWAVRRSRNELPAGTATIQQPCASVLPAAVCRDSCQDAGSSAYPRPCSLVAYVTHPDTVV